MSIGVAVVGCGNVAERYAKTLLRYEQVSLVGAVDPVVERARSLAGSFGGRAFTSFEAALADETVELVLNLTPPAVHAEVTARALEAGKHAYSEKPLALDVDDAHALATLASRTGLRLGCAPCSYMGEAAQTAWLILREGRLGTPRIVYAEVNHGQIERWHPAPEQFFHVGPLVDVGVYPLTIVTAFFGPVRRVHGFESLVHARRNGPNGPFDAGGPDLQLALLEMASGPLVRLTANFYVGAQSKQRGMEFHGDTGSVFLSDWQNFDASVEFAPLDGAYAPVAYVRPAYAGTEWARGVIDMVDAIEAKRPHRASATHALHVVEVLSAVLHSAQNGNGPVEIESWFPRPEPMPWADGPIDLPDPPGALDSVTGT